MVILRVIAGTVLFAFAALFAFAWIVRYWIWRDCFNELGRCWDPVGQEVLVEQAGLVWGGLTIACLVPALLILLPIARSRHRQR